jgi:DNA-binding GntR family transcriptional regulator
MAAQLAADRGFHELLHGLAGSRPLSRVLGVLWDSTEAYRALFYAVLGGAEAAEHAHGAIIEAVATRDAERVVALQDAHREHALASLRAALSEQQGG